VARYLLPCSVRTSLGATMPSRETERQLTALLASPHDEIRSIASRMRDEAMRINPGLLKHIQPTPTWSAPAAPWRSWPATSVGAVPKWRQNLS
jgi:thymidylate synthase ThyX